MSIDLKAVFTGQISFADATAGLKQADLYTLTDDLLDAIVAILDQANDAAVTYVPRDPAASDQSEQGWTINHIVAHLTATLEESAAAAAMLARGVLIEGRLRYETPWEELPTLQKVQARLQESRRMCHAFLDAWPDEPHLDVSINFIPQLGPMNAIGRYVLGYGHGQGHLDQLRDTLGQYLSSANR